jgi:CheY-like chemotaxis protein
MNDGPILIVDSDFEDKELFQEAWKELEFNNELKFFNTADDILAYLKTEEVIPFLIISEVKLPKINGFELKKKLLQEKVFNYRTIPFVFLTTTVSGDEVKKVYDLCSNGLFIKKSSFEGLKQQLIDIVRYWFESVVPE